MPKKITKGRLLYAASEGCADLLYETGFSAPDPFLWYSVKEQNAVVVSILEVGRAVKQCHPDIQVMSFPEAARRWGMHTAGRHKAANYIAAMARHLQVNTWEVPASFPYGLAAELLKQGNIKDVETAITQQLTPKGVRVTTTLFAAVPIFLVYPFMQRYFIKGIMIGAVKG